ncbi:diaminopimelate epimerase [Mesoterricola silvestris]|uniref:Diaminopimelate epimerase n=1 Tax=Mesoterricola silvestris TaxID=2927979 RepID=A0AA48H2U7_9BACT|nr:hypothetical protein [Mesoterricola silvestris]BDU74983.1 diaminopimelate epimerase [Mesoterricola silvestris]
MFTLASASGNSFAYAWDPLPGGGAAWARAVCPGRNLDGLFLLARPAAGAPWVLEHWDADGASTFCSNGTRAALAVPGAPPGMEVEVLSNGEPIRLRREGADVAIRMPSGPGTGFRPFPAPLEGPHAFGWVGNPQLVLERAGVAALDLGRLAPPLRNHPALPGGTNVNVLEVLEPGTARIRSWERGVEGETPCCGTGCAVAGAWLARRTGIRAWRLLAPGGAVAVTVEPEGEGWRELWLSGPVVAQGTFDPGPSLLS